MATINPLSLLTQAQFIAQQLGVNSWQIQSGSYNGEYFHIVPSLLDRLNKTFNPAAGIIDATRRGIGATFKTNADLPYGTTAVSTGIRDGGSTKLVTFSMPNNADVFERMGVSGEIFTFSCILFGSAYSQAYNNIFNKFLNDNLAEPASERNVLVHPILGRIENVALVSWARIHNPNMWRCCQVELTFRSTMPVFKIQNNSSTLLSKINAAIAAILTITTTLLNTWGTIKALHNNFGSRGNTTNIQQALMNAQTSVQKTVNVNLVITQLMVNNLQPAGYVNVGLNNTQTTSINNLPFINYYDSNMTPTDVNTIIEFNNSIVSDCIAVLNQLNTNTIYDTVTNLYTVQAQINQLGISLLDSFYGSTKEYEVPYNTDLFNVCFINSLDFATQSQTIWQLNKGILNTVSYIKKGMVLLLPNGSSKGMRAQ